MFVREQKMKMKENENERKREKNIHRKDNWIGKHGRKEEKKRKEDESFCDFMLGTLFNEKVHTEGKYN